MAATPEVKAKNLIKKRLAEVLARRHLPHKIHWNGGGLVGVPRLDCDGVIAGYPFAIEVKRFDTGGKVTARQILDVEEYRKAGAFAMIIRNEADLAEFLAWVEAL